MSDEPGLLDTFADTVMHSARSIEDAMDTDDDGSVLDTFTGGALEDVPIIGGIAGLGEELGDFATDLLGTRDTGIFSEEGTREADSSDPDYQEGSNFEGHGLGAALNDEIGVNDYAAPDQIIDAVNPFMWGANAAEAVTEWQTGEDAPDAGDLIRSHVDELANDDQVDDQGHVDYDGQEQ